MQAREPFDASKRAIEYEQEEKNGHFSLKNGHFLEIFGHFFEKNGHFFAEINTDDDQTQY